MISFKSDSVFLEAPVQFPEMLLLPEFARGEASIVVTIKPATRLQLAKKENKKVAIEGSLSSSRCCIMMYACPPSNHCRRWVMRRENIEGGQT
jgi:hypothetical protein